MKYITSVRNNPLNKISTKQFQYDCLGFFLRPEEATRLLMYYVWGDGEKYPSVNASKHVFFCNSHQIIWHDLTEKGQANFVSAVDDIDVKNM